MSKFEDLIGFIKQFMNWAASHQATRKGLPGVTQNGRFFLENKGGARKLLAINK